MKLFNETPFRISARRAAYKPTEWFLSVIAKGTFALAPDGACQPLPPDKQQKISGPQNFMDEHGNSRKTDRDVAPFKPRADCLFVGSAFAPGGQPVDGLQVVFGVGDMRKRLAVWGDRAWVREADGSVRLDGPRPFTEMPIRNEYAHGGPTSNYNRHGIGFGALPDEPGATLRAANIMAIDEGVVPWDRDQEPAGLGVLAPDLLPRRKLRGTHDADWLYRRRPLPPRDFDPAFTNGARRDQQVEGFLQGDEEIYLENLHPERPVLRSRLPGLRVRCFVRRTAPHEGQETTEFAEVLTNLDTCIVDATRGLVTLLWRGTLAVVSLDLEAVHHMLVVTEPVGKAESREFYLEMMNAKIEETLPPQPETEPSDEVMKEIAELDRQGIEDMVANLREGNADEALIAEVEKQETVDDAMKVLTDYVEEIKKTLPTPPET